MHEGPGSFRGQRAGYKTNLPQMVKTRATYTAHMPGKGRFLVQSHPQVPHSSGKQDTREAFQQDGKINFGQLHTATNPDELCLPRVQPPKVEPWDALTVFATCVCNSDDLFPTWSRLPFQFYAYTVTCISYFQAFQQPKVFRSFL